MKIIFTVVTSAAISAAVTMTFSDHLLSSQTEDGRQATNGKISKLQNELHDLAQTQSQLSMQLQHALRQINSTNLKVSKDVAHSDIHDNATSAENNAATENEYKQPVSESIELLAAKQAGRDQFQKLEDSFYTEGYDNSWDAEMQHSFAEVETRLQEFNQGGIRIVSQECRSTTCRVEFNHDDSASELIPVLLAAQGSKGMTLQKISDQFGERTIALYFR